MAVSKLSSSRLLKTLGFNEIRYYSQNTEKRRKLLKFREVKIINNPSKELMDEFMKGFGKQRYNFKRNDMDIWRNCFKDRYNMVFVCLRDTNRIIHTAHFINYEPVAPHSDIMHQHQGFFWIDPEFRGPDSMRLVDYYAKVNLRNVCDNAVAQCLPATFKPWEKIYGHIHKDHIMNVSYYKPEEMRIPEELKFDGIHVKSAHEVADSDIIAYDNNIFPYERSKYILTHLRDSSGFGKVAYDDDGNVIGFGSVLIYPSGECVLTPLYADDTRVAQAIFKNILQEIPLDDKNLLRFQIRSIDKNTDGYEWIQPFVKSPIRKEVMGHMCYQQKMPYVNYKKVFANVPYTTSAV